MCAHCPHGVLDMTEVLRTSLHVVHLGNSVPYFALGLLAVCLQHCCTVVAVC